MNLQCLFRHIGHYISATAKKNKDRLEQTEHEQYNLAQHILHLDRFYMTLLIQKQSFHVFSDYEHQIIYFFILLKLQAAHLILLYPHP